MVAGSSARAHRLRHLANSRVIEDDAPLAPSRPITHGNVSYRSGRCRCDFCTASHAAAAANLKTDKATGRYVTAEPRSARLERARRFLEDGTSYREAAASVGTDLYKLYSEFPGYEQNAEEFRSVLAAVKNKPKLLELHREIWQGSAKYNKVY